jgi:hypothetical protein
MFKFYSVCNYGFIKNSRHYFITPTRISLRHHKICAANKLSVNRRISLNDFIAAVQVGNEVSDRFATAIRATMILHFDEYLKT